MQIHFDTIVNFLFPRGSATAGAIFSEFSNEETISQNVSCIDLIKSLAFAYAQAQEGEYE